MKNLNNFIDEINFKKKEIAMAISLAINNGDMEKAQKEFSYIHETIDRANVFIFKTNNIRNSYAASLQVLMDEIKDCLGYNIQPYIYSKAPIGYAYDPFTYDLEGLNEITIKKLKKTYFPNSKMFLKIGVSFNNYIKFYKSHGIEETIRLSNLVSKLARKKSFFSLKNSFSSIKDFIGLEKDMEKALDVIDEYKISSLDDLFELYTLVSSFDIDITNLNEEEKTIIDDNKKRLYDLFNNKDSIVNLKSVKKIKLKLEKVFNNEMISLMLKNSNIKDFMDRYDIEFNSSNLLEILKAYVYVHGVDGYRTISLFGSKKFNMVFFNDKLFSNDNSWQNEVILHEFIHCLENNDRSSIEKPLNVKCKYLNEVMTQYIALEAKKYIKGNIIKEEVEKKVTNESVYKCLMPYIEVLRESALWNDLLACKKINDYSLLEDRIGENAMKIAKIFDRVYAGEFVSYAFDTRVEKDEDLKLLVSIVYKIERKNPRYNKKMLNKANNY